MLKKVLKNVNQFLKRKKKRKYKSLKYKEVLLNGYVMLLRGIMPCLRIGGMKSFRLAPSEVDKISMNKKSRMMGDYYVRFCERLTMQNVGLLKLCKGLIAD